MMYEEQLYAFILSAIGMLAGFIAWDLKRGKSVRAIMLRVFMQIAAYAFLAATVLIAILLKKIG